MACIPDADEAPASDTHRVFDISSTDLAESVEAIPAESVPDSGSTNAVVEHDARALDAELEGVAEPPANSPKRRRIELELKRELK